MVKINLSLSEDEYENFLKFLYFSEYILSKYELPYFYFDSEYQESIENTLNKIYSAKVVKGRELLRLFAIAETSPFSEKKLKSLEDKIDKILLDLSYATLSFELAENELQKDKELQEYIKDYGKEDLFYMKRQNYAKKYMSEFSEYGVKNIKFKNRLIQLLKSI